MQVAGGIHGTERDPQGLEAEIDAGNIRRGGIVLCARH
jgi:hypothetical protein